MKLNNSQPLAAAIALTALMTGCASDYNLRYLGNNDSTDTTDPIEDTTPGDDNGGEEDTPPADTPPGLPGSSILENTCFAVLNDESIAPLDTTTQDYYVPVLDFVDRTRAKLGQGMLERLRQYDPGFIDTAIEEFEESGETPTVESALEKMRELLAMYGATVRWRGGDEDAVVRGLELSLGDRREDIDHIHELMSSDEVDDGAHELALVIPDIGCITSENGVSVNVNKTGPWDSISPALDLYNDDTTDVLRVHRNSSDSDVRYLFNQSADYCQGVLHDNLDDSAPDTYWFPEGTTCFPQNDMLPGSNTVPANIYGNDPPLLFQTSWNRMEEIDSGTKLLIDALSGGEYSGRVYFEGSWFEEDED